MSTNMRLDDFDGVADGAVVDREWPTLRASTAVDIQAAAHRVIMGPRTIEMKSRHAREQWKTLWMAARGAVRQPNVAYRSWAVYEAYGADLVDDDEGQTSEPRYLIRFAKWDVDRDLDLMRKNSSADVWPHLTLHAATTSVSIDRERELRKLLNDVDESLCEVHRSVDEGDRLGDQKSIYYNGDWGWMDISWTSPTELSGCSNALTAIIEAVDTLVGDQNENLVDAYRFRYDIT